MREKQRIENYTVFKVFIVCVLLLLFVEGIFRDKENNLTK